MPLHEMIYLRKSCRRFAGKPADGSKIEKILSCELKPVYPDIVSRDMPILEV